MYLYIYMCIVVYKYVCIHITNCICIYLFVLTLYKCLLFLPINKSYFPILWEYIHLCIYLIVCIELWVI